jgi:glycine/D-amino acid oxidase-like deaminating enzyme
MITKQTDTGGYRVPLKEVRKYDVIVVGAGPAGVVASVSAARNGASVLLIERQATLGGVMTVGGISGVPINGYLFMDANAARGGPRPYVVEGISLELYRRLQDANGAVSGKPINHGPIDSKVLAHVLDEMVLDAGVTVLLNTVVFDAVVENGKVSGVAVANKSGGQIYFADVVIDCSADGDVAAAAGCSFDFGRPSDGRRHGGALFMHLGGIDIDRFFEFMKNQPVMSDEDRIVYEAERRELIGGGGEPNSALDINGNVVYREAKIEPVDWEKLESEVRKGNIPQNVRIASGGGGPIPGTVAVKDGKYVPMQMEIDRLWLEYVKAGRTPPMYGAVKTVYSPPRFANIAIFRNGKMRLGQMNTGTYECWFDVTDEEDVSRAILFMRKLNLSYFNFLREYVPGFEDIYILDESPMAGSREGRRIHGEYTMTYKDIEGGSKFPDVIALGGPRGADVHSVTGTWGTGTLTGFTDPYEIPYRCILPKDADNLLVAGRCASVDHFALGAMRDMSTCMSLGEAAGVAAAISAKSGKTPREVDIRDIQNTLRAQGAKLEFKPGDFEGNSE